jgi:hypothetical protein
LIPFRRPACLDLGKVCVRGPRSEAGRTVSAHSSPPGLSGECSTPSGLSGIGIFVIDPDSNDEQSVSTLTQLRDGRVDLREPETGDGDGELRVRGLTEQPREWTPFRVGE